MPCTQVANEQSEFGKWLYDNGGSCKDGNSEQCWRNIAGVDSVHKS